MLRFSKSAQSTVKRPYQSKTVLTNKNFSQKVNTAKAQAVNTARPKAVNTARPKAVNTARPKAVNTARPNSEVVNTIRDNQANAVKASACWATFPISHISRSLMEDMLPLVEELEEERSLVKMCDKNNCVLFTDTACFVLSPDFKLPDESQILLKNPRKNNMYSVDMKNIVLKESLTCLVAKATLDESILWHRRLGHLNFKTINKLVKDNLVRGLPQNVLKMTKYVLLALRESNTKPHDTHFDLPGSLHINTVSPTVITTRSNRPQTVSDIFSLRDNVTPKATNADLFGDETEMDMSNLNASYQIEEEVYVCQSLGFGDLDYPDKKVLCLEFEKLMHEKFKMSSMGELTFFLGLQLKQKANGIFISQDKYVTDILKKFSFQDVKTASTPMDTEKPLLKDSDGDDVDVHLYRLMIGSLMYLTSSRLDIMFAVCACARFQVTPKVSHSHVVKRIFRYLKGKPKLGLWYPNDSPFDLVAYSDSDYTKASSDRKSTTGVLLFEGRLIMSICSQAWMEGHVSSNKVCYKESKISRHVKRGRDTKIPQSSGSPVKVGDEAVHKELGDKMEREASTASSLKVEKDCGNINRTQSLATLNDSSPYGTSSGSGPRCQVTILGLQMLKLGLRLHLNNPMIHLSQELTHLEVGRTI
ncbi:uncharacterized mitochondrial protein-like protein [Tanacetum coccineum]